MLNKTTAAPENRRPWSWYRVSAPEEQLSGPVLLRSSTRVGAPEEPGSLLPRSWLLRSRVGDSQERPSPNHLIYNTLPLSDIHTLDTKIWTHVATQGKLSLRTPNKTKYSPRHTLVLDITKPSDRTHTLTINHTTRYLRSKGPYLANTLFLNVLTHHNQRANLIQTITSASSYYLNLTCHNVPNCNPTDFHKVLWFRAGAAQQVHESQSTAVRECI